MALEICFYRFAPVGYLNMSTIKFESLRYLFNVETGIFSHFLAPWFLPLFFYHCSAFLSLFNFYIILVQIGKRFLSILPNPLYDVAFLRYSYLRFYVFDSHTTCTIRLVLSPPPPPQAF